MDLLHHQNRRQGLLVLMVVILFAYVFFSPNLDHYLLFTYINQGLSHVALFYFEYIGTNKTYAYFFIALLVYTLCQWHLSHYVVHKALFIALSLAISVTIVQCAGVFFTHYVEHIKISPTDTVQLIHNSVGSIPGGHIARLVTLATCACFLINKQWIKLMIVVIASLVLVGVCVTFYDRMFIVNGLAGVFVGYWVPYYLKMLLFTQHGVSSRRSSSKM